MDISPNRRRSRSADRLEELSGEMYRAEPVFIERNKLQTGAFLIGRMMHLCRIPEKGEKVVGKKEASKIVAEEVCGDWIAKNVYPMIDMAVALCLDKDYEEFNKLRKYEV